MWEKLEIFRRPKIGSRFRGVKFKVILFWARFNRASDALIAEANLLTCSQTSSAGRLSRKHPHPLEVLLGSALRGSLSLQAQEIQSSRKAAGE